MASIERRQAHLRRIRARFGSSHSPQRETVPTDPESHFHIGRSQNIYKDIGSFLRDGAGDPAMKVSDQLYAVALS